MGGWAEAYEHSNPDTTKELRRRERELWHQLPTCKAFVPWASACSPSTTATAFNFSVHESIAVLTAVVSRGFIGSVSASWSDWLAHHETLYYHSWQRVECPKCLLWEQCFGLKLPRDGSYKCECGGTGTIPRPIMEKRKCGRCTDGWVTHRIWHGPSADDDEQSTSSSRCEHCGGSGSALANVLDTAQPIQEVRLTTLPIGSGNLIGDEWTCERWPTITFSLPESAP